MTFDSFQKGVQGFAKDLQGVHDSFKGNAAYDSIIADLERIDWSQMEQKDIAGVAKGIGKTATSAGIDVGRSLLTSFLKGIDPTGGVLVTGAEMVLDWGADMLYSNMWGENLNYELGDLVVVLQDRIEYKTELRRRLPEETVDLAVVTSEKSDGMVEVTTLPGGKTKSVQTQQVKRVPPEIARNIPGANNFQKTFQAAMHNEPRGHQFRQGDSVVFGSKIYYVEDVKGNRLKISHDGKVVNVLAKDVRTCFQRSWAGIHEGQIAWKPHTGSENTKMTPKHQPFKYEAVMIKQVDPGTGSLMVWSLYDGAQHVVPWWTVFKSKFSAVDYPEFMFTISGPFPDEDLEQRRYKKKVRDAAVGRYDAKAVLIKDLHEPIPLGKVVTGNTTPFMGRFEKREQKDRIHDDYGKQRVPEFDPPPAAKENSNTTVLIVGAAGVFLFLMYK